MGFCEHDDELSGSHKLCGISGMAEEELPASKKKLLKAVRSFFKVLNDVALNSYVV